MTYPEAIEVNGHEYPINTGYEYALACFACVNDPDLSEVERAYGVLGILYKELPANEDLQEALRLAIKYLQCGDESRTAHHKADMDFQADEKHIKASFLSDYRIDLDDEVDMHWWKFCTLLQGLSDNCVLNRVRDIRNYDISTVKDPKSRQKLIQAQRDLALPERISQEEQSIIDDFFAQLEDNRR